MPQASARSLTSADLATLESKALVAMEHLATLGTAFFSRDALATEIKKDGSPVSDADKSIEMEARARLREITPNFGFAGEETGHTKRLAENASPTCNETIAGLLDFERGIHSPQEDLLNLDRDTHWLLDPIDGTLAFLAHVPTWSTLLALVEEGTPVLGIVAFPALGEVFVASRGNGTRHGRLGMPLSTFRPCRVSQQNAFETALISTGTAQAFAWRGLESWYEKLLSRKGRTPQYTDAFGHTRVLLGTIDAMVDPVAYTHDLAALQVLFSETPGAFASSSHGHTGGRAYARGSLISAGTVRLGEAILNEFWSHMANTPLPPLSQPLSFFADEPTGPLYGTSLQHPTWARALESAIATFKLHHPEALVEDVSVVSEHNCEVSSRLRNGSHNAPPRTDGFANVQIRAVVAGGTGQVNVALPCAAPEAALVRALTLAWAHSQEQKLPPHTEILALRPQVSGHFGNLEWGHLPSGEIHANATSLIALAQTNCLEKSKCQQRDTPGNISSLRTRISIATHHRSQYFSDGTRQTISTAQSMLTTTATSQLTDNDEQRRETSRRVFLPELASAETLQKSAEQALEHCAAEALELLKAAYGAHLCRTIGVCGKDGQSVLTSDGGPMILILNKHNDVCVIGTGDSEL